MVIISGWLLAAELILPFSKTIHHVGRRGSVKYSEANIVVSSYIHHPKLKLFFFFFFYTTPAPSLLIQYKEEKEREREREREREGKIQLGKKNPLQGAGSN